MKLVLRVCVDDVIHCYSILNGCDSCRVYLPEHFVIYIFKEHNHSYYFRAFFYKSLHIFSDKYCNSKSKLYSAIQYMLEKELYHVVQF